MKIIREEFRKRYRSMVKNTHKGIQGHALIVGGSYGKIGSIVLASKACLKTGCGLVTAFIPKCGYEIIQISIPEVMVQTDDYLDHITNINLENNYQAIGIGMGMGQNADTQRAFHNFLKSNKEINRDSKIDKIINKEYNLNDIIEIEDDLFLGKYITPLVLKYSS